MLASVRGADFNGASVAPNYGATWGGDPGRKNTETGRTELETNELRMKMFGPPGRVIDTDPLQSHWREYRVLHEAWARTAPKFIKNVIINTIKESDQWMMREILPWINYEGGDTVQITQYEYNDHVLDDTPELGVSRLIVNRYNQWQTNIPRRGKAFMMEDGFLMSDAGIEQYGYSLAQIRDATLRTLMIDGFYRLLTCPKAPDDFYELYGLRRNEVDHNRLMEEEAQQWAILNKSERGYEQLELRAKEVMANRGVVADSIILPDGTLTMYRMRNADSNDYSKSGPRGPEEMRAPGGPIAALTSFKIYEAKKMRTGADRIPFQPLERVRMQGEFFIMPYDLHKAHATIAPDARNIIAHDNKTDQLVQISFVDAIKHSGLFDADGKQSALGKTFFGDRTWAEFKAQFPATGPTHAIAATARQVGYEGKYNTFPGEEKSVADFIKDVNNNPSFVNAVQTLEDEYKGVSALGRHAILRYLHAKGVKSVTQIDDTIIKALKEAEDEYKATGRDAALVKLGLGPAKGTADPTKAGSLPVSLSDITTDIAAGTQVPLSVIIARPYMYSNMACAIVLRRGTETGGTYMGFSDMQLGTDVNRKALVGHFTVNCGVAIHNPNNVYVMHNVRCMEACYKGSGVDFWDPNNPADVDAHSNRDIAKSLFSIVVPATYRFDKQWIDLTGYFPDKFLDQSTTESAEPHYPTAALYSRMWGWQHAFRYMGNDMFHAEIGMNTRCARATQWMFGHSDAGAKPTAIPYAYHLAGVGHWGPIVYPGVRKDRSGRGPNGFVKANEVLRGVPYVCA